MRIYGCKNETQARTLIRVIARTMSLGTAKCYSVERVDYSKSADGTYSSDASCYKSRVVAWEVQWDPHAFIAQWNAMRTKEEAKAGRVFEPFVFASDWAFRKSMELATYCRGFDYAAKRTNNPGW